MLTVALILSPGFQVISLAVLAAFELANHSSDDPIYSVKILSEDGGLVSASLPGVLILSEKFSTERYDTVIFAGGLDTINASIATEGLVKSVTGTARRVAGICTGAFILAQAGVLDDRRVTTHWATASELQKRYPQLRVDADRIYIKDGKVWTSAGASAGIDLALGMIEEDLGAKVSAIVAKKLVLYHRRSGGQSQHSALLEMEAKSDRVQLALDYAKRNLAQPLSVEKLAEVASLSPRQFSRTFRSETGVTPAKAIEQLRLEAARLFVEQTYHSIDIIAAETGFADRERMRRSFIRAFGIPPQAMRNRARADGAQLN